MPTSSTAYVAEAVTDAEDDELGYVRSGFRRGETPVQIIAKWRKAGTDTCLTRTDENEEYFEFHYSDGKGGFTVDIGWLLPREWSHLVISEATAKRNPLMADAVMEIA